jgi:hypothetical protein
VEGPSTVRKDLRDRVGPPELRTIKGRAQDACRRAAAEREIAVRGIFGTRAEGDYVVVLMGVTTRTQRTEVTCRYNPADDTAIIAR